MATNVTEKDKTLNEIIDWCEQMEADGLRLASARLMQHDTSAYGVMVMQGQVSAYEKTADHCRSLLGYSGSMPSEVQNQSEDTKMSVLYHGGVPDLKPGDTIEPGHSRDNYDDCPICRARREKGASAIEGTGHPEQVYCTRYRDYAALYASMYGKGDVYQVRPVGGVEDSDEDFDGCYRCDRLVGRKGRRKTRHPHAETPPEGNPAHAAHVGRPLHQPTAAQRHTGNGRTLRCTRIRRHEIHHARNRKEHRRTGSQTNISSRIPIRFAGSLHAWPRSTTHECRDRGRGEKTVCLCVAPIIIFAIS